MQTLGRMYSNRGKQHKRRLPRVIKFGKCNLLYDYDSRRGFLVTYPYRSTQAIIDEFRKQIAIGRCLIPIDVEHLLPPAS